MPTFGLLITSFRPSRRSAVGLVDAAVEPGAHPGRTTRRRCSASSTSLVTFFVNSIVITLPAVVIPISLALLAAYAFAWIDFKGRAILFVAVFALQIVPIQITLIPLLTQYVDWGISGSFWTIWLSHSMFALPLAIFLLHNFMKDIPPSLVEAARMDGAGHVKIFFQVLLPLLTPAIASFAIFQFLWVWNDLLVALTFAGGTPDVAPLTVRVAELAGPAGRLAGAVRRCLHLDGRAADRLPQPAAVLRPRPAGGVGQGLSTAARGRLAWAARPPCPRRRSSSPRG